MPTEAEMEPKDKYTIFDRNARKYRKGIHSTFYNPLSGSARPCDNGSANSSYRGSQVDSCFPACQSSRFLRGVFMYKTKKQYHFPTPLRSERTRDYLVMCGGYCVARSCEFGTFERRMFFGRMRVGPACSLNAKPCRYTRGTFYKPVDRLILQRWWPIFWVKYLLDCSIVYLGIALPIRSICSLAVYIFPLTI
jgi:hypothetical protein